MQSPRMYHHNIAAALGPFSPRYRGELASRVVVRRRSCNPTPAFFKLWPGSCSAATACHLQLATDLTKVQLSACMWAESDGGPAPPMLHPMLCIHDQQVAAAGFVTRKVASKQELAGFEERRALSEAQHAMIIRTYGCESRTKTTCRIIGPADGTCGSPRPRTLH